LNTSSFVNGEEGINEYGLVSAMTFVVPKKEEIKPGLNSLFLVRYILENCTTVQEGINALKKLPIASSCNILLADKTKEIVVVECNPFKINIRYPETNENGEDFIVTVNHFSSKLMSKHDASNKNVYSSKKRYETAYNALKKVHHRDAIQYAMEILSGKYGFMCQYKKIKFETIWSSVFDITDKKIYIAEGNPMNAEYVEDKRLKFSY
jgi:predicted choloylglycine hydrolase